MQICSCLAAFVFPSAKIPLLDNVKFESPFNWFCFGIVALTAVNRFPRFPVSFLSRFIQNWCTLPFLAHHNILNTKPNLAFRRRFNRERLISESTLLWTVLLIELEISRVLRVVARVILPCLQLRLFVGNEVLEDKVLFVMLGFKNWDRRARNNVAFNRRWNIITPVIQSFLNHRTLRWTLFLYLQPLNGSTAFLLFLDQGRHVDVLYLFHWDLVVWDHLGFCWIWQRSFVYH